MKKNAQSQAVVVMAVLGGMEEGISLTKKAAGGVKAKQVPEEEWSWVGLLLCGCLVGFHQEGRST